MFIVNMKLVQIIFVGSIGLGLGVASTAFYYNSLYSNTNIDPTHSLDSDQNKERDLDSLETVEPTLPKPSPATLARIKELEEATAHLVKEPPEKVMIPVVREVMDRVNEYEPAPADVSILSEQDQLHAELTQASPREYGEFIDATSPYQIESESVSEPSALIEE